jgi:hypothetical protein
MHSRALAARLEFMACVAEGAPYVARGLLLAHRFEHLRVDEDENTNRRETQRILERLKAANEANPDCPGAVSLRNRNFIRKVICPTGVVPQPRYCGAFVAQTPSRN